jgi:hypothetical protein
MKTILIGVVCLLIGLVVGRFLPSEDRSVQTSSAESADEIRSAKPGVSSRVNSRVSSRPGAQGEGETGGPELTEPGQDSKLVSVPAALIRELSLAGGTRSAGQDLFSRDGKMEKLLQITDQEKAVVQKAWRQSCQKIQELEARSSKSEDQEDGSVQITVPDLSRDRGELGKGFQSSVNDTLGDNRGSVFLAMKQVDRMFAPKAGQRVYTVSVEAVGDGRWRYHMASVDGDGKRRVWVGEKVPNEIRHLTDAAKIVPSMHPPEDEEE